VKRSRDSSQSRERSLNWPALFAVICAHLRLPKTNSFTTAQDYHKGLTVNVLPAKLVIAPKPAKN
jgi:phosphatidylserine synthase